MQGTRPWLALLAVLALAAPALADPQADLVDAAGEGHAALVSTLLRRGTDVNAPDREGRTALMRSAREGHMAMVQLLLDHGAGVTLRDWRGQTALSLAEAHGHVGVAAMLKPQAAFAEAYLALQNRPGKHALSGGTLTLAHTSTGATHMVYAKPGMSIPTATMVARTLGGPGLNYGAPRLEGGWLTFAPVKTDAAPVRAKVKLVRSSAPEVQVWLD